jgi:hypothetical protein
VPSLYHFATFLLVAIDILGLCFLTLRNFELSTRDRFNVVPLKARDKLI